MAAEHGCKPRAMEHASVAAFARLATELMAVAAPLELVARTSIAVALLATLQRSIASHRRAAPGPDAGVAALGVLSGSEMSIIGGVILEEVVLPTLLALLEGREQSVCTDTLRA
jgi:hypothetical protein